MRPIKFITSTIGRVRSNGREGVQDVSYTMYRVLWDRINRIYHGGENIYNREWDVLVLLDGCRYDTLEHRSNGRFDVSSYDKLISVGANSEEWMENTFTEEFTDEISNTIYVTGNPFSESRIDSNDFAIVDEVWRHYWDYEIGTVPAEAVTDRAVYNWRDSNADRMIVHYMQPHFPCVPNPQFDSNIDLDRVGESWDSVWDKLRKGKVSESEVRTAYENNLDYVLGEVEILVDAIKFEKAVISADHANSFGRYGLYGHPRAPISDIRQVPWCKLRSSKQAKDYSYRSESVKDDIDVRSKLKNLGYLD